MILPMLNMEGGPFPSLFVADIAISIIPFPMFWEQGNGSMLGGVQTCLMQDVEGIVSESQGMLVLESVYEIV